MLVVAEGGIWFVLKVGRRWEVRKNTGLVSIEDSAYADESLALARLKYLAGRFERVDETPQTLSHALPYPQALY